MVGEDGQAEGEAREGTRGEENQRQDLSHFNKS